MTKKLLIFTLALFFTMGAYAQTTGCTDAFACNYNPAAILDDGSCLRTTQLMADINLDASLSSSYPQDLTVLGNDLYFRANDGIINKKLIFQ
tara:strand:- start:334 stop:609 length:276 start_codon:yes stop_codon:yes gene_type:complete